MSRKTWDNAVWHFVAGVDPITSSFFELWRQPWKEQDSPSIMANNHGVTVEDAVKLPESMRQALKELLALYDLSRRLGNHYPNLDWEHADRFAKLAGFNISAALAELYD